MKIIHKDIRKGIAKVRVENLDDLWFLSQIIDAGDLVKGKTFRKIKIGEKAKVVKKSVFVEIKVEGVEFSKTSDSLRVSGKIVQAPDDIPRGSYHTFNVEVSSVITITKEKWLSFQVEKLEEASKGKIAKILICCFDREEAVFAMMKKYGYEVLSRIKGEVKKKVEESKKEKNFYEELIKKIGEYDKRYKIEFIVVASPAFWTEEMMKHLKDDELKAKIIVSGCSDVETGVNEVLKRSEVRKALQRDRITREVNLVEELFVEISKEGKGIYGFKEVQEATNLGAVDGLLVTDGLIKKLRAKDDYEKLENLMKAVDSMKGNIHLISSEHDGGKKLDGLGGVGALLRFKLNY